MWTVEFGHLLRMACFELLRSFWLFLEAPLVLARCTAYGRWRFHPGLFPCYALHGSILSIDNLHCQNRVLVNACPMCLADEEIVDHLLLRCKVAQAVWSSVFRWFDCCWTFLVILVTSFQHGTCGPTLLEARLCGGLPSLQWFVLFGKSKTKLYMLWG